MLGLEGETDCDAESHRLLRMEGIGDREEGKERRNLGSRGSLQNAYM